MLIGVALVLAIGGCLLSRFVHRHPERPCSVVSLVLDAVPFPARVDARADAPRSPLHNSPRESAGLTIYFTGGIANHEVYQTSSTAIAARQFRHEEKAQFSTAKNYGPWQTPEILTYRSPIADQYHVACGTVDNIYMCITLAQYEEYYVWFHTHISSDGLHVEDLEPILRAIDERMADCLGKTLPPTK